ncbi:hypothetical protein GOBAR_DD11545 [Gossypium barbadense]|nr:hypothetical protein GOBAR_DD11545 [Gossypium barbadense]
MTGVTGETTVSERGAVHGGWLAMETVHEGGEKSMGWWLRACGRWWEKEDGSSWLGEAMGRGKRGGNDGRCEEETNESGQIGKGQ